MAGIFTRPELAKIMGDNDLTTEEKTDRIFSMYGMAINDGYVTKTAARESQEAAINAAKTEWEKNQQKPDIKASEEYKALETEYAGYKAMQAARSSDDYKDVKGKFFDTVYSMVDRNEGAKPVTDQLAEIRKNYEEYFNPQPAGGEQPKKTPQFSQQPGRPGTNPDSEEDKLYKALSDNW